MAIARDWLEPTETEDHRDTQYVDHLLEDWGKWQRSNGLRLRPTEAGEVLRINATAHRAWDLNMTDDQFTLVDRCIARTPTRLRVVIFLEYVMSRPQAEKWQTLGGRLAYRQRLHAAQWALITLLGAILDKWRQKSVNPAQTCRSLPERTRP
jgi:hypothetical protein